MISNNLNSKKETKRIEKFDIPLKLDEVQKAIVQLKETIDDEASTVQEERSHFEEMRRRLDGVHFKKHIKLNVGGQIFKTSLETLLKDPDSMLASMFSERFDVKPDEEDGAYFIDRDGTHFRYVLNYLRTGKLIYPKGNRVVSMELLLEAEFYQIIGMQNEIWPGPTFQNSGYIINSLNEDQTKFLMSLIPTPCLSNWVQLFTQASGWYPSTFHSQCDKKGPTVILARAGNYIFGGYTEISWDLSGKFIKDENSFLFTLVNATGAPPTKLPQLNDAGGIWCHQSYGPCFGTGAGITVHFISGNNNNNMTFGSGDCGFQCPPGQNMASFICGSNPHAMNYLEVFHLTDPC